jgi:superfamily I DNA/RNA helicase
VQPPPLSDEQQALADHSAGHLFAEACPGAGKTRAIVARYLRRTEEEPRKGIALLSFTNAAVDEVKSRCGDQPEAIKAPNFVGTFDSFINRFITRPLYVHYYKKTPRFIESWQDTKHGSFRISAMAGERLPDFELRWFRFDGKLGATFKEEWSHPTQDKPLKEFAEAHRSSLENEASSYCRNLVRSGIVSCDASRAFAAGLLQRPDLAERFGRLLANRFTEVIVDEAQDCGPEELVILRLLKQYGVTIVGVADLDQSIYAFRGVGPAEVLAFTKELGDPLTLNGNYRSSPAICALNSSLRLDRRTETACGPNASVKLPVFVVEYKHPQEVRGAVESLLVKHGRPRDEVMFLAHREVDAQEAAGVDGERESRAKNAVLVIAWAHVVLRSRTSTASERLQAVRAVERILKVAASLDDEDRATLDERWLREAAYRLAVTLDPAGCSPKNYAANVREYLGQMEFPLGITRREDRGNFIKSPKEELWPTSSEEEASAFRFGTIHSAKGREFPTVVVVLPRKLRTDSSGQHVLDYWTSSTESEARRVLYVGASRAETLLVLAVHEDHAKRVAEVLKRDGVPHDFA